MIHLKASNLSMIIVLLTLASFLFLYKQNLDHNPSIFALVVSGDHSTLSLKKNTKFSFDDFDQETKDFLEKNGINEVVIHLSENPTPVTLSEHTPEGQAVEYMGATTQQEDVRLIIDLYINSEAYQKLYKDNEDLLADSLQQIFFSLDSLQRDKFRLIQMIDQDSYNGQLNKAQQIASKKAGDLIEQKRSPYTINKK